MTQVLTLSTVPSVTLRKFTASEYYTMLNAGVFHEDDQLELVEGEIVEMSPINPLHAGQVTQLTDFFKEHLGKRALVGVQNPLDLGDDSQPQPDLMVLKPRKDFYKRAHPVPADVLLLIEVSDSTVGYDRNVKAPLYARTGVPELWIVNLPDRQLEIYRNPTPGGYGEHHWLKAGEAITPNAFPDLTFAVDDMLGTAN